MSGLEEMKGPAQGIEETMRLVGDSGEMSRIVGASFELTLLNRGIGASRGIPKLEAECMY